jgi:hypothetical protein
MGKSLTRTVWLATMAMCLIPAAGANGAGSKTPSTDTPAPAVKESRGGQDLYLLCGFYPRPGTCEKVYQRAMKDPSIAAEAVRAEYLGYARYLRGGASLTDADRQYLKENGMWLPGDLTAANQAGLHNVINDPGLNPASRRIAVNNFLSRAVEAELYCRFNNCGQEAKEPVAGV